MIQVKVFNLKRYEDVIELAEFMSMLGDFYKATGIELDMREWKLKVEYEMLPRSCSLAIIEEECGRKKSSVEKFEKGVERK